jgi:hypothetical protein
MALLTGNAICEYQHYGTVRATELEQSPQQLPEGKCTTVEGRAENCKSAY